MERLVAAAIERFGHLDTYVANAMVTVYADAHLLEDEELRRVFDVNFFGGVYGYWAALPHLRDSQGTFIQIASALSYRGIPLQAAYCSTKAALRTFFECARVELQKERAGVDVCVVLPGAINTPQFDRARQKMGFQPQPVPPIYEPEPFAAAVVRCCERPERELTLGWGALAPHRRPSTATERLEGSAHGSAQARRFARQPLRAAPGRPRRAWPLRRALPRFHRLDLVSPPSPADRGRPGIGYHGGATSGPLRPLVI